AQVPPEPLLRFLGVSSLNSGRACAALLYAAGRLADRQAAWPAPGGPRDLDGKSAANQRIGWADSRIWWAAGVDALAGALPAVGWALVTRRFSSRFSTARRGNVAWLIAATGFAGAR